MGRYGAFDAADTSNNIAHRLLPRTDALSAQYPQPNFDRDTGRERDLRGARHHALVRYFLCGFRLIVRRGVVDLLQTAQVLTANCESHINLEKSPLS
jgi:hypothetical protein